MWSRFKCPLISLSLLTQGGESVVVVECWFLAQGGGEIHAYESLEGCEERNQQHTWRGLCLCRLWRGAGKLHRGGSGSAHSLVEGINTLLLL